MSNNNNINSIYNYMENSIIFLDKINYNFKVLMFNNNKSLYLKNLCFKIFNKYFINNLNFLNMLLKQNKILDLNNQDKRFNKRIKTQMKRQIELHEDKEIEDILITNFKLDKKKFKRKFKMYFLFLVIKRRNYFLTFLDQKGDVALKFNSGKYDNRDEKAGKVAVYINKQGKKRSGKFTGHAINIVCKNFYLKMIKYKYKQYVLFYNQDCLNIFNTLVVKKKGDVIVSIVN